MFSLYVVDYQGEVVSAGGRVLHDAQVCGNEVQALNRVEQAGAGILLLHYSVLEKGTPEFISLLKKANSELKIVVVGHHLQTEDVIDCVWAGAGGYHNIDTLDQYIDKLINAVGSGEAWISRKIVAKLIELWRAELRS